MRTLLICLGAFLLSVASVFAQGVPGQNSSNFQYLSYALTQGQTTGGITVTPTMTAWNSMNPAKYYSMSVTSTASGGFQVVLEGSVNNTAWRQIAVTNSALGAISNTVPMPSMYFRMRAPVMPANATITATALGVW